MTERDRAAVDVHGVHVGLVDACPGQHHGGEGLVDLGDVDVAHLHAGLLEHLGGRLHGTVEVVIRLGADECLADDAGPGLQAERARLVLVHPQHRGGAVGDLRRRARGVNAVGDDGLQRRQSLEGGVAQALVARDDVPLAGRLLLVVEHGRLDAADLAVEPAFGPRLGGLALRVEAELVDVLAGDATALGDALGGGELVRQVDVPGRGAEDAAVRARIGAKSDATHGLDAACDADVDGARRDEASDEPVGLLAAATLAVHRHRADVFWQASDEPAHPGDVVGLFAELGDAPADDLLYVAGVDAGLLDERLLRCAQ